MNTECKVFDSPRSILNSYVSLSSWPLELDWIMLLNPGPIKTCGSGVNDEWTWSLDTIAKSSIDSSSAKTPRTSSPTKALLRLLMDATLLNRCTLLFLCLLKCLFTFEVNFNGSVTSGIYLLGRLLSYDDFCAHLTLVASFFTSSHLWSCDFNS